MRMLITGGNSAHARCALQELSTFCEVCVVDYAFDEELPNNVEVQSGDLRDEAFTASIVRNVDAIFHCAPLSLQTADAATRLDHTMLGTLRLVRAAQAAGVGRIVLGSSMNLFATAPQHWPIGENWRPRPRPQLDDLCAWLAECSARDLARTTKVPVVCVRFGEADETVMLAIHQALLARTNGWRVIHAVTNPMTTASARGNPVASRTIQNVVIFGAGGPLAAAAARELAPHYRLRLTDIRPLAEIIAAGPRRDQHPGAPMPSVYDAPHQEMVVDVTRAEQVMAACAGMDAVINCTVIRHDVPGSFRVNALGAYHVMEAAVAHGIRRIVHTGPFQIGIEGPEGYNWDDRIVDDVPPRPGNSMNTYLHSKYLGQEICRIFAEFYELETPALLFCDFADFVNQRPATYPVHPFTTTWTDAARAIRSALEAPTLPSPFEIFHINSDLPHGVFPNDKAKRLLGWRPQDPPESWWKRMAG
jgi:nucleoside-diphosphate-sugar epimerase